jgi:serine phosphatase RsbU (regulator of sigma subunit)
MFNVSLLLYLDYRFEDWAQPFPGRMERYMDVWFSIIISFIVNYIAISVVLKALHRSNKQLEEKYSIIRKDVDLASKIQQAIMSYDSSETDFDVASIYKPVSGVGGDVYSIDMISKKKARLFLADATGHGVQAGLVTMLILSEYLKKKLEINDPGKLIQELNESFIRHYSDIRAIFTCIVLDWDFEKNKIQYASAGHIPQLMLRKKEVVHLEKTGPIIGLKNAARYRTVTLKDINHTKVLLFSDGITEAFDEGKNMFGEERLVRILRDASHNESMSKVLSEVEAGLDDFLTRSPLQDDLTLIAIGKH